MNEHLSRQIKGWELWALLMLVTFVVITRSGPQDDDPVPPPRPGAAVEPPPRIVFPAEAADMPGAPWSSGREP